MDKKTSAPDSARLRPMLRRWAKPFLFCFLVNVIILSFWVWFAPILTPIRVSGVALILTVVNAALVWWPFLVLKPSSHRRIERPLNAGDAESAHLKTLLESIPDAVVIVDGAGIIRDINTRTEILFAYSRGELIGQNLEILVPEQTRTAHAQHLRAYEARPAVREMGIGRNTSGRRKDGSEVALDIKLSPLRTARGSFVISIIRDISERKRAELERERLILEQRQVLERVKRLQGLLPICSYCKRIRNDQNYWQQVESYISEHSDAQFSHGVCPECYEQILLPELHGISEPRPKAPPSQTRAPGGETRRG